MAASLAPKSARQRLWLVGGAFVAFVLLLIGYLGLIGPQRDETSAVDSRVDATRTANAVLQSRIAALQAQNQRLSTYRAQAAAALAALPGTNAMPVFLRTLQTLGTSTHTNAVNVTVGTPVDVTATASGTSAPAAAAASSTPVSSTSASTNAAASAPASPGVGPTTVYGLPITAQVNGSPSALGQFLKALQEVQPRAVLITQITQGSASGDTGAAANTTGSTLQLTMQAFYAPGRAATTAQLASASGR